MYGPDIKRYGHISIAKAKFEIHVVLYVLKNWNKLGNYKIWRTNNFW